MTKKEDFEITREKANEILKLRKGLLYSNVSITGISKKEYKIKRKIREILGA